MTTNVCVDVDVPDREWPAFPINHDEVLPALFSFTGTDVEARPWRTFADQPGVRERVLWGNPETGAFAGIIELAPEAGIAEHIHRRLAHHLFVLSGTCEIAPAGRVLATGSYAVAEPGVTHGIGRAGLVGCRIFLVQAEA
jgi:quercetin dioxygenase-like cupin family protein